MGGEELVCTAMATEDDDVVQESENEGEEAYEGEEMQGNDEINNAGANVSLVILAYFCKWFLEKFSICMNLFRILSFETWERKSPYVFTSVEAIGDSNYVHVNLTKLMFCLGYESDGEKCIRVPHVFVPFCAGV